MGHYMGHSGAHDFKEQLSLAQDMDMIFLSRTCNATDTASLSIKNTVSLKYFCYFELFNTRVVFVII